MFSREANLMHRTLVTNFSFMDFPLQDFTENSFPGPLDGQQAVGPMTPLSRFSLESNSRHAFEVHKPFRDDWMTQLASFERQLGNTVPIKEGVSVKAGMDSHSKSKQSGGGVSADRGGVSLQGGVTHSEQSADKSRTLSRSFPASSLEALVADTLKPLPKETQHEVTVGRSTPTIPQDLGGAGLSVIPPAVKPATVKPSTSATMNANILKTKQLSKSKKSMQQMSASTPLPGEEDVLDKEVLMEAGAEGVEVDGVVLQKSLSKLEMKQLRRAQSERDKFQSDPAKFNQVFNQELMAYADACCFSGLVSMEIGTLVLTVT